MRRRQFLQTGATAAATVTTPLFIGPLAQSSTFTELALSDEADIQGHGSDGHPSFLVAYESAENQQDLREEVRSYDEGKVLREYPDLNMMAVTLSWEHAGRKNTLGLDRFGGGLEGLDYVRFADANLKEMSYPDPVDELETESTVSLTSDLTRRERLSLSIREVLSSKSSPTTSGLAFDGDAPEATLVEARDLVGADDTVVGSVDTSTVTVAVIDTGINPSNTLAESRLHDESTGYAKAGDPTVGADGASAVADGDGHGTWVTHCIAGTNGFAPDAEVLALKSLGDDGGGETADIVAGIEKATDVGADVAACLSLGSPKWSEALADALEKAYEAGVLCAVAAGNDRYGTIWIASPASAESGLGVQATNVPESGDRDETQIAYFGNIGPHTGVSDLSEGKSTGATPHIAAPGMNISVEPEGSLTGTSMAAPMVAGAATLLRADGYSVDETWDRLTEHAHPLPEAGETETQNGLLDVEAALNGTEPDTTQAEARTDESIARDEGNRLLSNAMGARIARLF